MVTHAHTKNTRCVTKLQEELCVGNFYLLMSLKTLVNYYSINFIQTKISMSIKKLAEEAPGGPELGTAQPKLVCKYYQTPILLCDIFSC